MFVFLCKCLFVYWGLSGFVIFVDVAINLMIMLRLDVMTCVPCFVLIACHDFFVLGCPRFGAVDGMAV